MVKSKFPPPPSGMPKPSGPPLSILLYGLCLVPITAFAGWVVTYGQDEEALERKLRAKYGPEIRQVESKKQQMSEFYRAAIKNPGSSDEQERRLQQVLRGGKGEVKRHEYDPKYYGTEEGLELQQQNREEMHQHLEEERKKQKKVKRKVKKKKEKQGEGEGETSTDNETEEEARISSRKKKAAAAGAAFAAAVGSNKVNKAEKTVAEEKPKSSKKKKKKTDSSMGLSQIATLTAVAGAAAMVGFLVGGGSRRQ